MVAAIVLLIFLKLYHSEIKDYIRKLIIKLPGGTILSAPQSEKSDTEKNISDKVSSEPQSATPTVSTHGNESETFKDMYTAERKKSYFGEYSFLNYFYVPRTQQVLTWFTTATPPISLSFYDSIWMPSVPDPKERRAVLDALEKHHMVLLDGELIKITEKGREYAEWRYKVLNPPIKI